MNLRDTIDVVRKSDGQTVLEGVPAHVGYRSILSGSNEAGRPWALDETLEAITRPLSDVPNWTTRQIRWRGTLYDMDGPPMVRRQHGRDHHMTFRLQRQTG